MEICGRGVLQLNNLLSRAQIIPADLMHEWHELDHDERPAPSATEVVVVTATYELEEDKFL